MFHHISRLRKDVWRPDYPVSHVLQQLMSCDLELPQHPPIRVFPQLANPYPPTPALLIRRRPLDMIDNDCAHGAFGWFQLQPKLLLNGRKEA